MRPAPTCPIPRAVSGHQSRSHGRRFQGRRPHRRLADRVPYGLGCWQIPASISGWTCDWGGPDNFLQAWLFNFVDGQPFSEFAYDNPQLADVMNQAVAATDPRS